MPEEIFVSDVEQLPLPLFLRRPLSIAGIICAVVPFGVHFNTSATNTINGEVIASYYRDYPAILFGGVGLLIAVAVGLSKHAAPNVRGLLAAVLFTVSAWHVVNGFGVLRPGFTFSRPEPVATPEPVAAPKPECTEADAAACNSACDADDGEACDTIGIAYAQGSGGLDTDELKAMAMFDKACRLGSSSGCKNGAVMFRKVGKPERAFELGKRGCELSSANACSEAGLLIDEKHVATEKNALPWFEKACELGSGIGCQNLGNVLSTGRSGASVDLPKAAAAYEKACDKNVFAACNNAALASCDGTGVKEDAKKCFELLEKSCKGEYGLACRNLGLKYLRGEDVERDALTAEVNFLAGCIQDDAKSCVELARLSADASTRFTWNSKACDLGELHGCHEVGVAFRTGDGVEADLAASELHLSKVCDGGEQRGCFELGLTLATVDPVRAKPLLTAGCKQRFAPACKALKTLKPMK